MAIKSTIFKANVAIADIDNGYYADHNLTLARHPSETDERMMVRLAALAFNAHRMQAFQRRLCPHRIVHEQQRGARARIACFGAGGQRTAARGDDGVLAHHEERVGGDEHHQEYEQERVHTGRLTAPPSA